jgi:hypothetical protein
MHYCAPTPSLLLPPSLTPSFVASASYSLLSLSFPSESPGISCSALMMVVKGAACKEKKKWRKREAAASSFVHVSLAGLSE